MPGTSNIRDWDLIITCNIWFADAENEILKLWRTRSYPAMEVFKPYPHGADLKMHQKGLFIRLQERYRARDVFEDVHKGVCFAEIDGEKYDMFECHRLSFYEATTDDLMVT